MSDNKIPPPRQAFATSLSTLAVTALRLLLILTPHCHDQVLNNLSSSFPTNWIYSPSLISIFIKPHWTLDHVKEAHAIQQLLSGNFVNAYQANQSIRLPPLVLAALSPLLSLDNPELWLALMLLLVDFGIAYLLEAFGRQVLYGNNNSAQLTKEEEIQRQLPKVIRPAFAHIFPIQRQQSTSDDDDDEPPLFRMASLPLLAAQLYYGCPITMLASGLYYCFQTIPCLLVLLGLHESSRPRASYSLACFWVALACYMELHNAVFLMPLLLWLAPSTASSTKQHILVVVFFLTWSASLQGLSFGLVGPSNYWNVLEATYGVGWKIMSPNLSVMWYFHMQLFTRFRDYFGILLIGLPYLLVIPLTIRLHAYPMVLTSIFWFLWTIFRPIETLNDLVVGLCFMLLSPQSLARMYTFGLIALCSLWVPVVLYVLDCWMWLETGSGNANYIYFQCLAYNAFLGILLGQFCTASLQRDKALRITVKEQAEEPK